MTDVPTLIYWLALAFLGYWLATAVFAILAARTHFELRRHDLLARSKQRRREYLESVEERMAGVLDHDETDPRPQQPA